VETESIREIGKIFTKANAKAKSKRTNTLKSTVDKLKEQIRVTDSTQISSKEKSHLCNFKSELRRNVKELVGRLENTRKYKRVKCQTPWGVI
jgi:hypothetical protein